MAEKHTPMPAGLTCRTMEMSKRDWAALNGGDDLTILHHGPDVVACVWSDDDHDEMATAAKLARAYNAYDALLEALKDAEELLSIHFNDANPVRVGARAAIARAEGK